MLWQSVPVLNNTLIEEMPSNVETRSLDLELHTVSLCTIAVLCFMGSAA